LLHRLLCAACGSHTMRVSLARPAVRVAPWRSSAPRRAPCLSGAETPALGMLLQTVLGPALNSAETRSFHAIAGPWKATPADRHQGVGQSPQPPTSSATPLACRLMRRPQTPEGVPRSAEMDRSAEQIRCAGHPQSLIRAR
jgi:hypothetical protein